MTKSPAVWIKVGVLLAGLYFLSQVSSIYLPVILAMVLSFVLNPLVNKIAGIPIGSAKYRIPRGVAILIAFVIAGLILSVIVTFVLFPFVQEFNKLVVDLPTLIDKIKNVTTLIGERASNVQLSGNARGPIEHAFSSAAAYGVSLLHSMVNAVLNFASQIVELVVVPVLTYYFLRDWREIKGGVVAIFPSAMRDKVSTIIEEMATVISNYIRGQVLISVLMGLLVFSGLYLLKVDYPVVLGLLATLTETIPIIGPIIGAVPAVILAYIISPALAVKAAIFYIAIHQIENHVVVPNIMGHTIELHPVIIIISLLVGGQLAGIAGMILAVPVTALLRVLLKHLWNYEDNM
ncbi:MAG TPA: AI-2E family transporter [Methylomusa anaerophila]|uniref:AI-2 transport protein TqsA n=1 Tax=Methylomusa anaerophila TaxID=1930071 RepID=A0A348AP80_9FIRM|nr:AI-2E family transporter [Methylomusa anaerophila]BBB92878.1 AI-2 transport protein TqsA [Methylomusa anaerophila]HML87286.1 AI-2E family transporter [Methylomusa anaerophila]